MNTAEALAVCESTVRHTDPDRYFAGLFAPADKRPLLYALYAYNHELARVIEVAREPMMGEVRLQWWREALQDARNGHPRAQPAATGLAEIFSRSSIGTDDLEGLIDAREIENISTPFATLTGMELHAQATSAALMRIAGKLLDADRDTADLVHEAGIAYGICGMLRSFSFHAARGKLFLPIDLLDAEVVSVPDALSGRHSAALSRVVEKVTALARDHFARAAKITVLHSVRPAVLPAALVPAYLSRIVANADPSRGRRDILLLRRQFILLRAAALGRL